MALAVEQGADGVELDIHRSADGALVVHHDPETGAGPIGGLNLAAIQAEAPDVPTLPEVLDVCRGTLVNVELKDPDPRAADALVELLGGRAVDDVVVSSFDWGALDRVRAAAPHLPTGLLSFGVPPAEVLATAVLGGHTAVHPDVWTLSTVDVPAFVARAHEEGVQVNVWTVNDAEQVVTRRDAGIDAVITDDDDLYRLGVRGRPQ